MLNEECVQVLIRDLDFGMFESLIKFMSALLNAACNGSKRAKQTKTTNIKLTKHLRQVTNSGTRQGSSASSQRRHLNKMNECFNVNANQCDIRPTTLKTQWINQQYKNNSQLFDNNNKILKNRQKTFVQQQKQLWRKYKESDSRVLNETLDAVNKRVSIAKLQSRRVAVCLFRSSKIRS